VKEKKKINEFVVICICGMSGGGKSTLAKKLAAKYELKNYSGGDALKALVTKKECKQFNHGWWESDEGIRFLEGRVKESKFDYAVDKNLLEQAQKGNVVLDSWTMPWLFKDGFKIWLEASRKKRAQRLVLRDGISFEKAMKVMKKKEEYTKAIYKKLYGFNLGDDFTPFHLILDTEYLKVEEVFQVLCSVIDNVVLNPKKYKNLFCMHANFFTENSPNPFSTTRSP